MTCVALMDDDTRVLRSNAAVFLGDRVHAGNKVSNSESMAARFSGGMPRDKRRVSFLTTGSCAARSQNANSASGAYPDR